ncbi:hypothetical protein Ancab_033395 [Ancistrocladus abbreviatus]
MRFFQTPYPKIVKEGQVINAGRKLWSSCYMQENGLLHVPKGQAQNAQAQMCSDPNVAMDMIKENLSMIIAQTLTFAWVNFFSDFMAGQFPFTRFRLMLQNGIDLSTVDVSYVSSRSWYFLKLFGLGGLFSLILREENAMEDYSTYDANGWIWR